jgi:hypothetical protein
MPNTPPTTPKNRMIHNNESLSKYNNNNNKPPTLPVKISLSTISNTDTINTVHPAYSKPNSKTNSKLRWGPHWFNTGNSGKGGKKRCRTRTCKPKGKPAKSRTSSRKMRMRRSSAHRNMK